MNLKVHWPTTAVVEVPLLYGRGVEIPKNQSAAPKRDSSSWWRRHGSITRTDDNPPLDCISPMLKHLNNDPTKVILSDLYGLHRSLNAEQFEEMTHQGARQLQRLGVERGTPVGVCLSDSYHIVIWVTSVLRAGGVVVPMHAGLSLREIEHLHNVSKFALAIIDPEQRSAFEALRPVVTAIGREVDRSIALGRDLPTPQPGDGAVMLFTSGTTGKPKGVLLSHANLAANAEALRIGWEWSPQDRLALSLPLFHMHGLGVGVLGSLINGSTMMVQSRFEPKVLLEAMEDNLTTMFFGVPTMYVKFLEDPKRDRLRTQRLLVSGSAPMSVELHRDIAAYTGQITLERYGMTEVAMAISNPLRGERRPGTVGFELPGVHLQLGSEHEGEILLRGPSIFQGYVGIDRGGRDDFQDEWFRTGDIGRFDSEGYLQIVGRSKELIITGGFNVYPREVEEVITSLEGVVEVAVGSKPSAIWGEEVIAWVVRDSPGLTEDMVLEHCRQNLVGYKVPKGVAFCDALPRNHMGKIQRDALRDA